MNLQHLFELQAGLDLHIEKEHPRQEGEDRLSKKILALQVELAECAQESRCFKFWSYDQDPRTERKVICHSCKGLGEHHLQVFHGVDHVNDEVEVCLYCEGTGWQENRNPLLEEYVDCLHFILSIGNETIKKYGKDLKELVLNDEILIHTNTKKEMDITSQFNILFLNTTSLYISIADEYYDYEDSIGIFNELFESFLSLGEILGFTWDQVEQAYLEKNKINHERQMNNY